MPPFSITTLVKSAAASVIMLISAASVAAQAMDMSGEGDEIHTGQILEALILGGAEQPLTIEASDYLGVLDAQGLSHSLPGVLASLFGSLPHSGEDNGNPGHAELSHTCRSPSDACSLSVIYVDTFDGERSESAVILSFTLIDGRLAPTVPVRLNLAG